MGWLRLRQLETRRTAEKNLIPFAISTYRGPYYRAAVRPILVRDRYCSARTTWNFLLDSAAAAKWLTAHGVHRTAATLRKLRCIGGGPRYRSLNGRPYYTANDLVAWIEERLSAPMGSTSEADAA